MPANLTPQYRAAEAALRAARTIDERRAALEEMLVTIPKHKGTEKMQADIKRRLARLRQELERRVAKKAHVIHVEPEGAAQVVLLGPPNSGKSTLLSVLTRAVPTIADYPFTTTRPQPGMMAFEDVQLQLVDLPPVTAAHMESWLPNVVQGADAALLLADPTSRAVPADVEEVRERLAAVRVQLVGSLPPDADPRDTPLPTLMVVAKIDVAAEEDVEVLRELYADDLPLVAVAAREHRGIEELKVRLWRMLQLVRVHTKPPGKPVDRGAPFVLPAGSTVFDLAQLIHQDLAEHLQYARLWGGKIDGQKVSRDHELADRDVVELGT